MAVPPIRPNVGSQTFPINLFTSAGAIVKSYSPEAGDFVIYVDFVSQGNLTVAEAPAGSGLYQASPSQAQTDGVLLSIRGEDQTSPAAWVSFWLHIWTTTRSVDNLAYPDTSGRGIAVTDAGAVAIDWASVENPTTTVGLSGTTVKAVTDAVNTGLTVPTAAQNADAVWDEAKADHVAAGSFGAFLSTLIASIWAYASRTLTQSAAQVTAAVNGSDLAITRGSTWSATLTGLPSDMTDNDKLKFMFKASLDDDDTAALVSIDKTGLLRVNGATAGVTLGNGSITAASATSVTITLEAVEAAKLNLIDGVYGVQKHKGTTVTEVQGRCYVVGDTVKATS